jgi:hypothetical protein
LVGKSEGKNHSKDLGIGGRIALKWILCLKGVDWTYLAKVRGPVAGPCEHGNESLRSIKGGKFLE